MPHDKAGDISHIFENPVPNLDWLDVDEDAYRALEVLPKQNLDFHPDLVDLWTHHEKGSIHFVPNIDPERLGKHQWAKGAAYDGTDLIRTVTSHLKDRMMAGWTGEHLAAWVRTSVPPEHLEMLIPTLEKIAAEQGLLGTVYLDVRHWDKCARGQGKDIARKAPHTKYVLGGDKCKDCILNQGGRCSVFKKKVVFDVTYDQKDVDEYSLKLKVPKQAYASAGGPREQLAALFTWDGETLQTVSDLAPIATEGNQEARDDRATGLYRPPTTDFAKSADVSLYKDLSQKMMARKGKLPGDLAARLATSDSEAVVALQQEENLLGRVYVRPDQFTNCHTANDFFRRHHVVADYILELPKCTGCQFYRASVDGQGNECGLMNKEVVAEVPYNLDMLGRDLEELKDKGRMTSITAASILARATTEPIKTLVAEAHAHRRAAEVVAYEIRYETQDMGHYANVRDIPDQETAVPLIHRSVVNTLYKALYAGKHGATLRDHLVQKCGRDAVVAAQEYVRPLVLLAGLLGNVILDPRGFKTAGEAKKFLKANRMHPKYILKQGCGCGGGAAPRPEDAARKFPGLVLINLGDIGSITGEYVHHAVDTLENHKRLSRKQAHALREKIGSVPSDVILREAFTTVQKTAKPHRRVQPGTPKVGRKRVQDEFKAANTAKRQAQETKLRDVIASMRDTDEISEKAAGILTGWVGKKEAGVILTSLERARFNNLKTANFQPTDVSVMLDQMSAPTQAAPKVATATQKTSFRKRLIKAMNKGTHSEDLKKWLRNSFNAALLRSEAKFLRVALAEQGLLGNHYIDPRPYKACEAGAREVADTKAVYVQAMKRCVGCVHRNANSHCDIYRRHVVEAVPYSEGKTAAQDLILNPSVQAVEEPELNPVLAFGMTGAMGAFDLDSVQDSEGLDIGFETALGELNDLG